MRTVAPMVVEASEYSTSYLKNYSAINIGSEGLAKNIGPIYINLKRGRQSLHELNFDKGMKHQINKFKWDTTETDLIYASSLKLYVLNLLLILL
ncbi:hypothetical protein LIER_35205 [Lithospermum erythrorhizon]|uniref:Uncharacterized protein n=1 Tax=Lithospermum erythrorhizon TaxID=34254 RepID=A0AAV3NMR7_LITER